MRIRLVIVCLFVTLLTGCSVLSPLPAPDVTTYRISTVNHQSMASRAMPYTLLVGIPVTPDSLDGNDMVYTEGDYQWGTFAKNKWVAPPAQMLLPLLVTSLHNTHAFHAVVGQPFAGLTDLRLNTQLLEFQQEFDGGSGSRFRMVLQAELVRTSTQRVISERRFTAIISAPEATPYGGVEAANIATQQILTQLSRWVVQSATLKSLPAPHWRHRK